MEEVLTDEELMIQFRGGSEGAFDELFNRHSVYVANFLTRMVGDRTQAEDLVQVTFLSLVRSRLRYEDGTKFLPWLLVIAGNAARDTLRRKRVATRFEQAERALPTAVRDTLGDPGLRKQLAAALDQLPEQNREAVVLHKVEGWSFDEIGSSLGITETAARLRAHRGYEKLRRLLAGLVEA